MTIYQVLNEQNYPVYEFTDFAKAALEAEMLNDWYEDHCFYVEVAEVQAS